MLDALVSLDRTLFLAGNHLVANPFFDAVFPWITNRQNWIVPGVIAAIAFLIMKKKQALVVLCLAIAAVAVADQLSVQIIKPVFHRLRPCHPAYFIDGKHLFLDGGRFLLGYKKSFAFPSAHAVNVFAAGTVLTMFYPRRWAWYLFLAACIAFSRVYVGVHYPSDLLGGALIGCVIGICVYYTYYSALRVRDALGRKKTLRSDAG